MMSGKAVTRALWGLFKWNQYWSRSFLQHCHQVKGWA